MGHESTQGWSTPQGGLSRPRVIWAWALGISVFLSLFAALRGGYIGPDYNTHMGHIVNATKFFDFSIPDPPLYILLGHGLFRLIGRNNAFPFTLAVIQVAVNTVALWWFFRFSEPRFKSPVLHLAFVLFLTFLPVRIIHVVSVGTDWTVIPVFVLVLFLFEKCLSEKIPSPKNATFLGLALALGIWSKYSFMALLPAIFVIFAFVWWKRAWSLKRFVMICAFSLVLPSVLVLYSYWQSSRLQTSISKTMWLRKGQPPEMNYKDLLLVKAADLELFKAPEMFKPPGPGGGYNVGYRLAHKHSYLALSHLSTFTDTQNQFQDMTLPLPPGLNIHLHAEHKTRRPWNTPLNVASMSLGTLWTVLALAGTLWISLGTVRNLWRDRLDREDITALLGTAYFLLMFLPIPFLFSSCLWGYWTPRLILPSLFFFFWAAFLLLDRTIVRKSEKIAFDILILVFIQCGIQIVMLA